MWTSWGVLHTSAPLGVHDAHLHFKNSHKSYRQIPAIFYLEYSLSHHPHWLIKSLLIFRSAHMALSQKILLPPLPQPRWGPTSTVSPFLLPPVIPSLTIIVSVFPGMQVPPKQGPVFLQCLIPNTPHSVWHIGGLWIFIHQLKKKL